MIEKLSKNEGKEFEKSWKDSMPEDVYYLRLNDGASSFGQDSAYTRFTPSNPYDCFAFYNGFFLPMELKSTKSSSISIQREKTEKGKMIKINQINGLCKASKFDNIFAGFVFDFRGSETYWMDISNFMEFLSDTEKKSINEKDVIKYKGILINKKIKRSRYTYDISKLLYNVIGVK